MENQKHENTEDGKTNYNTILSIYKDVDIGAIISMIGGISFLAGWVYDLGYFYVLNFKLLSVLSINDYVLSTITYLPAVITVSALMLVNEVFKPIPYTDDMNLPIRLLWIGYVSQILIITAVCVFFYKISSSADAHVVFLIGGLVSFASFMIGSAAQKHSSVSREKKRVITLFWVAIILLAGISYVGACNAALDLREDRLTDVIQTKTQQIALIRILSNGMLGMDAAHQSIVFVPNSEILSVSSRVNKNNSYGNPTAYSP